MLAAMFKMDSNFGKPGIQEDGAYFLDRDPEVFKEILLAAVLSFNYTNKSYENGIEIKNYDYID